eukprot:2679518-Pyramimonas_sp.AAC.1
MQTGWVRRKVIPSDPQELEGLDHFPAGSSFSWAYVRWPRGPTTPPSEEQKPHKPQPAGLFLAAGAASVG